MSLHQADSSRGPALVWFREDLRLSDNPALVRAASDRRPVAALYVFDEVSAGFRAYGGAKRWWLHHALAALAASLAAHGISLILRRGPAEAIVPAVAAEIGAGLVTWNRRYQAAEIAVDTAVKSALKARGRAAESFQGSLLYEPWTVRSKAGDPLKVFSPFWRAAQATAEPRNPLRQPETLVGASVSVASEALEDWHLLPTRPDWAVGLRAAWTPGERAAQSLLDAFIRGGLAGYAENRDRPDLGSTSRLSPYLACGAISPFQVRAAALHAAATGTPSTRDVDKFVAELGWREFSWHLLHHEPELATRNFQPRFDAFPWAPNRTYRVAWQRGRTGIPLVDAGMRQLWQTGWMHNRVRMIVGSFLVKHLLQDWRDGEVWFHDTLVDFDAASNAASWQWVAGSGADAAPYFRVFNPVLQGRKFDPQGDYVRRFVPELARLSDRFVHAPWDAPASELSGAGIRLGDTYPAPLVDLDVGRDRALAAFDRLKADHRAA